MSQCSRCGAAFQCGQTDPQATQACWCMALPPAVPVPVPASVTAGCWCPACLHAHIASLADKAPPSPA
ncbi:cysteine-rich CWC family protein [Janthinobacterium aquaticum]|uniref:cysteine-rich CWC family protein n=1 Tax=Janthinobacterium sp. FT58W TaxID=2654254 RepID=UPI0012642350|nr:cysteine-rich CWC family protein [Janthinobacterium sp. FT58W]KAB8039277.1 hypothetical protein GCM43_21075 [Janthinobacterium sp. FT58W]